MTDRNLAPCPGCRRHVADEATACPFCNVTLAAAPPPLRATISGRLSRAAVFAGAALAGCWTNNEPRTTPVEQHHDTAPDKDPKTDTVQTDTARHDDVAHHEFAKPAGKTSRIEGTLTETSSGQVQAGERVVLINSATQAKVVGTTDASGHYVFDNVAPGDYTLVWDETGNPRHTPRRVSTHVTEGAQVKLDISITFPQQQHTNIPMPYGAPPARRRVV